jgi:SPASM domain peptide maturase of grasp-with-spasm system
MKNKTHFILYSNCIPVKGFSESIIMDLQRENYVEIPNVLFDIITKYTQNYSIKKIKSLCSNELNEGIDLYFKYLEELDYGFFTNEPNLFPNLRLDFHSPFKILSSVICISDDTDYSIPDVLSQIIELGVQTIQIRIFKKINEGELLEFISLFKESRTKIVEIFLKDFDYNEIQFKKVLDFDSRISILIHSSDKHNHKFFDSKLIFLKENLKENSKEIYSKELFISNIAFFCESKSLNVGLNKKVCIDSNGFIKNYINHELSFGNVENTLISEILNNDLFLEKGNVNNDQVEKCKDCQYRYACLSNSDLIKIEDGYRKLDYCNFNPYENLWE